MSIRSFNGIDPKIHSSAFVDESAVVTGDVVIGADSSVWPLCSLRGDIMRIAIGDRTNIQDNSALHTTSDTDFVPGGFALTIGNDVTVGHGCVIHACAIEDLCLIGMGSVVLDGAVVQAGAMVGAASLVPPGKTLEGGFLWIGSPVKKARELSDKEKSFLSFSAESYVELKQQHM